MVTLGMLAICVLLAEGLSRAGVISLLTAFHFFRVISTVLTTGWVATTVLRMGWVRQHAQT